MRSTAFLLNRGLISRDEAETLLKPFLPLLSECIDSAWSWAQQILDEDPGRRKTLDPSTQASMVYNKLVELVEEKLTGEPGIDLLRKGRMLSVCFFRKVVVRFKKFDWQLRSKNVKTNRQRKIYYQQFELEGIADKPTSLTLGYVVDPLGRELLSLHLTCPISYSRNRWSIQIKAHRDENILPFGSKPTPLVDESDVQVIPKNQEKTAKDGTDV